MKLFVHIPKTAGTSLRYRLKANLGSRLACDYGPTHPSTHPELKAPAGRSQGELRAALERDGVSVLYGHTRYPLWNEAFSAGEVMSILRHPVDRCISHYQHYLSHGGAPGDSLATGVMTGELSLQEFAAAIQQRNLQAHQLGITEASSVRWATMGCS
ncbi:MULTISPECIES: sulfotransferase family 2 domain-containing protein [unclassified Thioalkalivibrio]|uniref:sulfotransferase family 2 domain-containing protein n=1 Tax=unclassified Thioalkalivibrio TaxID=2621013 RepID=UPI001E5F82A4|nr:MULTISPECIES: sulfotransferase family 2 domain-containing protein [unclassified Thioalkalivibrio]